MLARLRLFFTPVLIGMGITGIVFYRVLLFEDRALLYRDIYRHFLVGKAIWSRAVLAGEGIPFWNSFSYGGMRFWAENVNSPLNPANVVFLIFRAENLPNAMSLYIWLHYLALFLGSYHLGRTLRATRPAALLFASAVAASGVAVGAHNITHSLCSFTGVPWFLAYWLRFLRRGRGPDLFCASFALAWPIYAGDPQFAYVLCLLAATLTASCRGIAGSWQVRLRGLLLLGLLSFLAAAAQLLPTGEFILESARNVKGLPVWEILAFSFHPARLAELVWPQFFGNQIGADPFWGHGLVNFTSGAPFYFSIFPGTLFLLSSLALLVQGAPRAFRQRKKALLLAIAVFAGFLACFGSFSPVPLYEALLKLLPLFSSFRYPERLLFWPCLGITVLGLIGLPRLLAAWSVAAPKWRRYFPFFALGAIHLAGVALVFALSLPSAAGKAVLTSCLLLVAYLLTFLVARRAKLGARRLLWVLVFFQAMELGFIQNRFVWDQSKHMADLERNRAAKEVLADLDRHAAEVERGRARRFDSWTAGVFPFLKGSMDHASSTTYAGFDSLAPNLAGYFGVEDIGGYFALVTKEKATFWRELVELHDGEPDLKRAMQISGAYYRPARSLQGQIEIRTDSAALPYLFLAKDLVPAPDFNSALEVLRAPTFDIQASTVISPGNDAPSRLESSGELKILRRTGRFFLMRAFRPAAPSGPSLLVWNESYDRHWKVYLNGVKANVERINAWAMGVYLPRELPGDVEIRFAYENPVITLGSVLTGLWLLLFLFVLVRSRGIDRSGEGSRSRREGAARA